MTTDRPDQTDDDLDADPTDVRITVLLPAEHVRLLRYRAADRSTSLSAIVRALIAREVAQGELPI